MSSCNKKQQINICCYSKKEPTPKIKARRCRKIGTQRKESLARKLQYLFSPELCCPENCAIYGRLDKVDETGLFDRCFQIPNRLPIEEDSLGHPVGMVCSNIQIKSSNDSQLQSIHFATYLKAFTLIYILPEVKWTQKTIENLLEEGAELYRSSNPNSHEYSENYLSVYKEAELSVDRSFQLQDHSFTVELELFSELHEKGNESLPDQIIVNLKKHLQVFFGAHRRYCLFWSPNCGYLLIWKKRAAYFVLDIRGRRKSNFRYTKGKGVAMLMCLKTLDNIVFLISKLSGVSAIDEFQLRELVMTYLETPDGKIYARDSKTRNLEYEVITEDYAVLKSRLHLSLNINAKERNRSSIMVGVAAIIASKIDHSAGWNSYVYDRIICYGVKLCVSCWESCLNHTINLDTFPTQLRIGQFVAELKLLPSVLTGQWRCSMPYRDNDFEDCLLKGLEDHKSILFQINNQMYAIWCSHQFYYLLDPYRHKIDDDVTYESREKYATVRMLRTKEALLKVLHTVLLESNRSSTFYIHAVQLLNLKECPEGYALEPLVNDLNLDVRSLNETICFPNEFEDCMHELGNISDYEIDVNSYTSVPFDENFKIDDKPYPRSINVKEEEIEEEGEDELLLEGIESSDSIFKNAKNIGVQDKSFAKTVSEELRQKKQGNLKKNKKKAKHVKILGLSRQDDRILQSPTARKMCKSRPTPTTPTPPPPPPPPPSSSSEINLMNDKKSKSILKKRIDSGQNKIQRECEDKSNSSKAKPTHFQNYPSYSPFPQNMAVCGSESGTFDSLKGHLHSAFKCADRVLTMTPWGNYVVFRECDASASNLYYVFDGCTCDIDRFRYLDLRFGTAGFKQFQRQRDVISYIIDSREGRALEKLRKRLDDTCQQYMIIKK